MALYLNGVDVDLQPQTLAGTTDLDASEIDETAYNTVLTITPAAGAPLLDLVVDLDWNKATTGFDAVATAGDTLDAACLTKVDGTNLRTIAVATQVTANGDGSLDAGESGERFGVGMVSAVATVVVQVKLSAERGDVELPYRVTYRAASAPTVTAVAAG